MNRNEAKQAMLDGKKVTHDYFNDEEFMYMREGKIYDEQDILHDQFFEIRQAEHWNNNWELFE